jgi:glycosyltransferase involved in cell wall biosynthesis
MNLFVLPSLTEGLPNVVLEALAWTKPVISTAVGGVPEIIEDRRNGILVPPGCVNSLAGAIQECLASPDLMRSLGAEGENTIRTRFGFDEQNQRLENIYEQIFQS